MIEHAGGRRALQEPKGHECTAALVLPSFSSTPGAAPLASEKAAYSCHVLLRAKTHLNSLRTIATCRAQMRLMPAMNATSIAAMLAAVPTSVRPALLLVTTAHTIA